MSEKKLARVTATDYRIEDDDETVIQLTVRDEDHNRRPIRVFGTTPYLYLREDESIDPAHRSEWVTDVDDGYESFDGIPLKRVSTQTPKQTGSLAKEFDETWESDIPFYRRASIDYSLSGHVRVPDKKQCHISEIETDVEVDGDDEIEPRIFIADIEVSPTENVPFDVMKERAEDPITHITVWDSYEDEYIVLHLDPGGQVNPQKVSSLLDGHAEAESLSIERERDIRLRAYETEEDLLNGFLALFEERRPDLTSGWNWVDFDWTYLLRRFQKFDDLSEHRLSDIGWVEGYQTERKVDCLPAFDMMDAYCEKMSWSNWRSKSLDYVSKEVLGVGKVPNINISWAFENARDELVAYNIIDVMLCVAIDRREGVHEFFYELAELSQVQIYDTFSEMRLVDGYIMSRADDDQILPSAEEKDIPENAGGLVLNPSDGVRDWVGVLDLKSLYPSVIITWNISPETIHWYDDDPNPTMQHVNIPWLPDADEADGGQFGMDDISLDTMWSDLSEEGLIPSMIRQLFPERAKKKARRNEFDPDDPLYDVWDRKQSAVKVIMNSFYGVMSNDYWRLGKHGLGDAVTSAARYGLWGGKEITEDEGYEIYYGDTDSVMLSLADENESKEIALERGHELEDAVNDQISEYVERCGLIGEHPYLGRGELHGTEQHTLVYEFEKLYRRFFQAGSKKRYAGLIVWKEGKDVDNDIDMTGFESNRSDSPELTSEVQPKVIRRILGGDGFEGISKYIRGLIDDIESRDIDLFKVAVPIAIKQSLDEYGNTQSARACRYSNDELEKNWTMGDDPWMFFIDGTPTMAPDTDVMALEWGDDFPSDHELDISKTLERALEGPLDPILNEVGWKFAELKMGAQTQSAADWSTDDWTTEDEETDDEETDEWGW